MSEPLHHDARHTLIITIWVVWVGPSCLVRSSKEIYVLVQVCIWKAQLAMVWIQVREKKAPLLVVRRILLHAVICPTEPETRTRRNYKINAEWLKLTEVVETNLNK